MSGSPAGDGAKHDGKCSTAQEDPAIKEFQSSMTDDIGENEAVTRSTHRAHIHNANEENA